MIRVILHGASGAMGKVIAGLAQDRDDMKIVAGIDRNAVQTGAFPVYEQPRLCLEEADVIVDFSAAAAVDGLLDWAVERKLPLVLCTTGLSDRQLQAVQKASEQIPVLRSANMSVGVNVLFTLAAQAARILSERGYDIEILEKHHNRKLDAPSGTALAIADAMNEAVDGRYSYTLDRSARRQKRDPDEIGIQSVRGGTIVGEHDVMFCGLDEVIEIRHTAYSRAIFGKGALDAAAFLAGKQAGMYQMKDVLGL